MAEATEKQDGEAAAARSRKTAPQKSAGQLSKKMETGLNAQITAELYSAYLYQALSAWLESEGLGGSANWMTVQAREEMTHAGRFYRYVLDRGGSVRLGAIEAPPARWPSPRAVFQAAYEHELKITALIHNLVGLARAEGDYASEIFLHWFVTEQIEEEAASLEVVRKLELAGDAQGPGLYLLDQELGLRTLSPGAAALLTGQTSSGG